MQQDVSTPRLQNLQKLIWKEKDLFLVFDDSEVKLQYFYACWPRRTGFFLKSLLIG